MDLGTLIKWLEIQHPDLVVKNGFSTPHSDRGDYYNVAFTPEASAKLGDMLSHAKSAIGASFTGWKGGEYRMEEYTPCYIGRYGECGEEITSYTLRYWLVTGIFPNNYEDPNQGPV